MVFFKISEQRVLRGQGYDGAANMSGKYRGVQERVKQVVPDAEYTHCKAHNLNLCIIHACKEPLVRNAMDTIQMIAFAIDYSAKRLTAFNEALNQDELAKAQMDNRRKLKTLCEQDRPRVQMHYSHSRHRPQLSLQPLKLLLTVEILKLGHTTVQYRSSISLSPW